MRSRVIMTFLLLAAMSSVALGWPGLQSTYTIRGKVQDSSGRSLSGVTVCAFSEERSAATRVECGLSDMAGKFVMFVYHPGRYQLDLSKQGHTSQRRPFFKHPQSSITQVTLNDSNTEAFASLTLSPKNGILTGRAIDATTRQPIDDLVIVQCHLDNPQVCFSHSAKSGDGKFTVSGPHVPFTLKITASGYEDWFGLRGSDVREAISIEAGASLKVAVSMKRRPDSAGKALHESEKQVGVHLQAPVQLSPESDARFDHYPRLTKLTWAPVEDAASYTVEVDYCRGNDRRDSTACLEPQPFKIQTNPATTGITATTYEFSFLGAQPGRWRVWAVDKDGREGFKSPWRKFFYQR